jgi:acyl-CoA synthetase (NDP forming)
VVRRLGVLGAALAHGEIAEIEINPLVAGEVPVALDVLVRLGSGRATQVADASASASRPRHKLARMLEPRSIAIAGVSGGENIGRTILRNILRDGFDPAAITVVKPDATSIDGCACVPDVASLRSKVDLFVVAVSAARAAQMVAEIAHRDAAETIILIPGGLEETTGGRDLGAAMRAALARSRARPGGGPLVNGGNCMGIRSTPGHYDTLFVPGSKLAPPSGRPAPYALIAQSGGFVLARLDRLSGLDPKYVITVGNQLDLTVGDHLANLAGDPDIRVFGVYVEGFAPLDGRTFLAAARAIRERGGVVVLYRGGRTRQGTDASASHTAAIAGDAAVTIALARSAGVVVAETLEAFDDLLRAFVLLEGRVARGRRLGAMTNAGFECVAIADNLGVLDLARLDAATRARIAETLDDGGMSGVVDLHNPIDLTPMGGDAAFAAVAEAIIDSPSVDLAVVGDVPFTTTLQTLPASLDCAEDFTSEGSVACRLIELWARTTKPWVAVVDGGPRYDPLARFLEAGGIPTFRTADAALRVLSEVASAEGAGSAGRALRVGARSRN